MSSTPTPRETTNVDRFGQELPADEDTTVTDDVICAAGVKDVGGSRRKTSGQTGLVVPMDGRWCGDGDICKSGCYPWDEGKVGRGFYPR